MPRAPFHVLVYPYQQLKDGNLRYALFRRSDQDWWQAVAGGGEDDETPIQAARREAHEEAGIPEDCTFIQLTTVIPIPVTHFCDSHLWGNDVYVIPQYCFGVSVPNGEITVSSEHTEYRWLNYEEAQSLIRYDGNRTALWELHARLLGRGPRALGMHSLD